MGGLAPVRYVFVGGLHRSGTTLVADCLEAHAEVRGLPRWAAPEGEGAFLQGAIPHDALAGAPGRWASERGARLGEGGRYDDLEVRDRMRADWDLWYPPGGTWRVEKSPVNLLRARLYQQLFPACQFVFVLRDPVAVARATAKWSGDGEAALIAHWEAAHAALLEDLPRLHNWMAVRLEDLCAEPERELARLFAFLRLDAVPPSREIDADPNAGYLAEGPPAAPRGEAAAAFGYPDGANPLRGRHWFRDVREAIA